MPFTPSTTNTSIHPQPPTDSLSEPPELSISPASLNADTPALPSHHLSNLIAHLHDYQLTHGSLLLRPQPLFPHHPPPPPLHITHPHPHPHPHSQAQHPPNDLSAPSTSTFFHHPLPLAYPTSASLHPTAFPRHLFTQAFEAQRLWNMVYAGVAGEERWIGECLRRMGLLRVVEGRCEGDGIGFMGHDEEWGGDEDGGDELASMLWRVHCQAKEVRRARARERWKRGRGESQGKRRVGERRVELGIWRSDYMVSTGSDIREGRGDREAGDASALELKQVEFNTIACAGAVHGNIVADMHRHFASAGLYSSIPSFEPNATSRSGSDPIDIHLPPNNTTANLIAALASAHAYYDLQYPASPSPSQPPEPHPAPSSSASSSPTGLSTSPPASSSSTTTLSSKPTPPPRCILILTQPNPINQADERPLEHGLHCAPHSIPTFRVVFPSEFLSSTHLDDEKGALFYTPPLPVGLPGQPAKAQGHSHGVTVHEYEVSVAYLRCGHELHEYTGVNTGVGMEARVRIEACRAVLCPSVLGQLAGSKGIQTALSSPEVLSRFLKQGREVDSEVTGAEAHKLLRLTAPLFSLASTAGRDLARTLMEGTERAEDWVLKSAVGEGGGFCLFDEDIVPALHELLGPTDDFENEGGGVTGSKPGDDEEEVAMGSAILQRRIVPPDGVRNVLCMNKGGSGVSEVYQGDVVVELGVWGTCLFAVSEDDCDDTDDNYDENNDNEEDGKTEELVRGNVEIIENKTAGWSVRTKMKGVDEMSVVKGYGAFDSLVLVDT